MSAPDLSSLVFGGVEYHRQVLEVPEHNDPDAARAAAALEASGAD